MVHATQYAFSLSRREVVSFAQGPEPVLELTGNQYLVVKLGCA